MAKSISQSVTQHAAKVDNWRHFGSGVSRDSHRQGTYLALMVRGLYNSVGLIKM